MKIQNVDMSGLRRNTEEWLDYRYSMKPSSIVTPADYELVGAPTEKRAVNMGMANALLKTQGMRNEASNQFFENRINDYGFQPVQPEHRQGTSLSNVRSVFNKNNQVIGNFWLAGKIIK